MPDIKGTDERRLSSQRAFFFEKKIKKVKRVFVGKSIFCPITETAKQKIKEETFYEKAKLY